MALGRAEEVISETVTTGFTTETTPQIAVENETTGAHIAPQIQISSTSNQEAMVAQTLKRVKRQAKEIETIAKTLKAISADVADASKGQGKQLKQLQAELNKVSVAIKKLQKKSQASAPNKRAARKFASRKAPKKSTARRR